MDETVRKAFTDAWNLYKRYEGMENTDQAWEKLNAEEHILIAESSNPKFLRSLINSVNGELERKLNNKDRRK